MFSGGQRMVNVRPRRQPIPGGRVSGVRKLGATKSLLPRACVELSWKAPADQPEQKTKLLKEAHGRTRLNRKVLIRKFAQSVAVLRGWRHQDVTVEGPRQG